MINYATGAERNAEFAKRRCGFGTIVTSRVFIEKLGCPELDGMIYVEDILESLSGAAKLWATVRAALPAWFLRRLVHPGRDDQIAHIVFTSGSEGDPKPVCLTHRNIAFELEALKEVFGLTEEDSMLASLPFFHVLGLTANLWSPIYVGMAMATHVSPLEYARVAHTIRDEGITIAAGTPTFWWGYLRASEPGDFQTLRVAVVGADRCPDALRAGFTEKHELPLCEGYGATETSPVICVNTPETNKPGSVGKPLRGVEVRVEDVETGEECAVGESGRVLAKGDLVMDGYLNDREATTRAIRAGWYDTGDLGYLDADGYLWLTGRLTRCVKVGGEMVSLSHVERTLAALLPEDDSCCVVALPDPKRGSRIVAVLTGEHDESELTKKLAEELPRVAIPKEFVRVDEVPTLGGTKVDFRAAGELAASLLT
jgi:acyl-[acyl-carrier-protein]-phospholipid O-acyltransferase/long-chain-fatty-acid--[acyl-carrier-protein] ligase